DTDVTFDYLTGGKDPGGTSWNETRQAYRVWHLDATNRIDVRLSTSNRRIEVEIFVAGTGTTRTFSDPTDTGSGSGVTIRPAGKLRVQIKSNLMRVWLDGRPLKPSSNFSPPWGFVDLSTLVTNPANRKGLVGARQDTYRWPVLDGIAVRA